MIVYLLKSIVCLLILLLVHRLLLQREVMHRFNRFFLLFSVVASFLIPIITIEVAETLDEAEFVEVPAQQVAEENYYEPIVARQIDEVVTVAKIEEVQTQLNWEYLLFGLYGLISLVFLYRFVRNIKILVNKIQRNIKINYRGQTLVLLKEESLPFSWLKYIFVAESDLEDGKFTDAVFAHECAHIQEKHSWDNLFIEALLVPLWFHPGLHWAKASIKLNHEFIADEIALRSTPLEKYESQLLAMMLSEQKYGLASSLNFSLTKKRFEMMKRKSRSSNSWIKILALIPVLGVLVYFFSERVAAKVDSENAMSEVYVNASNSISEGVNFDLTFELKPNGVIVSEGEEYHLEEIKELLLERKSEKADLKINLITNPEMSMGELGDFQSMLRDLDIRRVYYMGSNSESALEDEKARHYSKVKFLIENEEMGFTERTYSQLTDKQQGMLLSPPRTSQKSTSSDPAFEAFRNGDEYESDIAHNSFVPIFPKEYDVLYATFNSYKNLYGSRVSELNTGKGTVTIASGAIWLVDLSLYSNPVAEFHKNYEVYEKLRNTKPHYINKTREDQSNLTALYYKLSGMYYQFNSTERANVNSPIAPIFPYVKLQKDGEVYYKLKEDLNDEEKMQLPSPPPPVQKNNEPSLIGATIVKNMNEKPNITAEYLVLKYSILTTEYEKLRNGKPHFVKKSEADQHKLLALYADLSREYYRIRFSDKPKVNRPIHPYDPYIKLSANGKVYYKLKDDLTEEESSQLPVLTPVSKDLVTAYQQIFLKYELIRQEGRNYNNKSSTDRQKMFEMYNELQDKFLAMEAVDRRKVKMVSFPYIPLEENGELVFKAFDELSPEQRAVAGC